MCLDVDGMARVLEKTKLPLILGSHLYFTFEYTSVFHCCQSKLGSNQLPGANMKASRQFLVSSRETSGHARQGSILDIIMFERLFNIEFFSFLPFYTVRYFTKLDQSNKPHESIVTKLESRPQCCSRGLPPFSCSLATSPFDHVGTFVCHVQWGLQVTAVSIVELSLRHLMATCLRIW